MASAAVSFFYMKIFASHPPTVAPVILSPRLMVFPLKKSSKTEVHLQVGRKAVGVTRGAALSCGKTTHPHRSRH